MRGRVVAGGLLHLVEAALLATQEEEQERQVDERQRRERRRTRSRRPRTPAPRPRRAVPPAAPASPTTAPATTGSRECERLGDAGGTPGSRQSIAAMSPAASRSMTRARCAVSNADTDPVGAGPLEQLRRLAELLVEGGLTDDERVVDAPRWRHPAPARRRGDAPARAPDAARSRARAGSSEKYSSAASRASSSTVDRRVAVPAAPRSPARGARPSRRRRCGRRCRGRHQDRRSRARRGPAVPGRRSARPHPGTHGAPASMSPM